MTRPGSDPGHVLLDELGAELSRVGIRGRARARIVSEAADHIAEGDVVDFGDPRALAQLFADELATQATTRAAFLAFAALAVAGVGFAVGWILVVAHGSADITSASFVPLGIAAAFCMIACPQVSLAAGLLSLLRARRLRAMRAAPAAELALLARRTNTALAFGAGSMVAFAVFAAEYHYGAGAAAAFAALAALPALAAVASRRAAAVSSSVSGPAGDMFDDFPVRLPRRPWLMCFALAGALAVLFLGAAGTDEGPRNAVAEVILVVAGFAALGRRLGLRR